MSGEVGSVKPNPYIFDIENRRKRHLRLAHDLGAGAKCNKCGDKCPGFELHFWRKICMNCRCGKDDHAVDDDDQDIGVVVIGKLFDRPQRTKKEELEFSYGNALEMVNDETGKPEKLKFDWVPPNTNKNLAARYMAQLPPEKRPVAGSEAAKERRKQLEQQLPLYDMDASQRCENMPAEELQSFEAYLDRIKTQVASQGVVQEITGLPSASVAQPLQRQSQLGSSSGNIIDQKYPAATTKSDSLFNDAANAYAVPCPPIMRQPVDQDNQQAGPQGGTRQPGFRAFMEGMVGGSEGYNVADNQPYGVVPGSSQLLPRAKQDASVGSVAGHLSDLHLTEGQQGHLTRQPHLDSSADGSLEGEMPLQHDSASVWPPSAASVYGYIQTPTLQSASIHSQDSPGQKGFLPGKQGALPFQKGFVPSRQGHLSSQEGFVPSKQDHLPGQEVFVPDKQGSLSGLGSFVPGKQGYLPGQEDFLPGKHSSLPGQEGFVLSKQGYLLGQEGFIPGKRGSLPSQEGIVPGKQGSLPGQEGHVAGKQGLLPSQEGFMPGKQSLLPGQEDIVPGKQGLLPGQEGFVPGKQGLLPGQEGFLPGKQGLLPSQEGFVPGKQDLLPGQEGFVPGKQDVPPGQEGFVPSKQGLLPGQEGFVTGKQDLLPGQGGYVPGKQGLLPGQEGFVPGKQGLLPSQEGFVPGKQGLLSGQEGFVPGKQDSVPGQEGTEPSKQGFLHNFGSPQQPLSVDSETRQFMPGRDIVVHGYLTGASEPANTQAYQGTEVPGSYSPLEWQSGAASGNVDGQGFLPQMSPIQGNIIKEDHLQAPYAAYKDTLAGGIQVAPGSDVTVLFPGESQVLGSQGRSAALPGQKSKFSCQYCSLPMNVGDVAIFCERAGPDKCWHPACFCCFTCKELLADLIYFFKDEKVYCGRHFTEAVDMPRCKACDELIFGNSWTRADDADWHIHHYCCNICDKPLAGQKYIPDKNGYPHCMSCYMSCLAKMCQTCEEKIAPDENRCSHRGYCYHANPQCFQCHSCKTPLLGRKFKMSKNWLFCSNECIQAAAAELATNTNPKEAPQ